MVMIGQIDCLALAAVCGWLLKRTAARHHARIPWGTLRIMAGPVTGLLGGAYLYVVEAQALPARAFFNAGTLLDILSPSMVDFLAGLPDGDIRWFAAFQVVLVVGGYWAAWWLIVYIAEQWTDPTPIIALGLRAMPTPPASR
jgi:hypothetical protein